MEPPDLPDLTRLPLESLLDLGELTLEGVIVEGADSVSVQARQIRIVESELRGVSLCGQDVPGAQLRDAVLHDCDLSNLDAREGSIRRVQVRGSRLVGFSLAGGEVRDLSVIDCTLRLSSFAFAKLRDVVFERVDLAEASFVEAQLDGVHFIDCELHGVDFRKAITKGCTIRGTSLDGVTGVESLKGITMPWVDVVASAATLASALGITVERA